MIKRILDSSLFKDVGIYAFFSMLNSAIPFFLLPVLTRYLSPEDYGILAMFAVLVGICRPFLGLNVHGAIRVKFFDKNEIDLPRYIGNCLYILLIATAISSFVIWLFADTLSNLSAFPKDWLWAVVLVAFGQFIITVLMIIWQVQNKATKYGVYQVLQTLSILTITIYLVVVLGKNWQGKVQAQLITIFVFTAYGLYWLYKNGWVTLSYSKPYTSNALKFGVPLIPHNLGGMLTTYTDRLFITNMVGVAATGIYTVGWQISQIITILDKSFSNAYVPWLFERLKKNDYKTKVKIVKFTYAYFIAILAFAVGLALLAPLFLRFFVGKEFLGAEIFILWVALGCAFSGMYLMVVKYIFYAEKTHILAWVTFFKGLLNVVLNYFFIKRNGAVGAAQATAITLFVGFILTWYLSARVYKMPWNLARIAR